MSLLSPSNWSGRVPTNFKNLGKASRLLFHFGVRRAGALRSSTKSLTLSTVAVSPCHTVTNGNAKSVRNLLARA
jgi:hypothetical protein